MTTPLSLLSLPALLLACAGAWAQAATPQRFVIERELPGASRMNATELRNAAIKSNGVLRDLGPDIQWVHSYVAGDKIYCVYTAPSEALIQEHAKRSGFPANKVTRIAAVIDPTTAR
jgi:hypothetical protein